MLLSKWQVPPLILSVQQFALGGTVLHLLQPIPRESPNKILANLTTCLLNKQRDQFSLELFYTGLFFGLGFVATNYSFQASAASFVETVKAAEPITSALVAVSYGVDIVGFKEALSLCGIVAGVLVSTVGKGAHNISTSSWVYSFFIIFLSNLCFSFRGLHQKLLQQTREGDKQSLTDVMLQYRMQWISVGVFVIPASVLSLPSGLRFLSGGIAHLSMSTFVAYVGLATLNGLAFSFYNLASTVVLTRLSVVHHAALNCVRRIFAILMTSMIFGTPIGFLGMCGIFMSFGSFMSFTHFKIQRLKLSKSTVLPLSSVN